MVACADNPYKESVTVQMTVVTCPGTYDTVVEMVVVDAVGVWIVADLPLVLHKYVKEPDPPEAATDSKSLV